uniref:C2H2-type domain-containing protein n=1 Tax=Gouania willdenowi TaxID=441366 RepID=A0A8C5DP58_GOUWI
PPRSIAACPVKSEDEEEKPQTSQLHWRQLTEMNMKEEPSTCSLNELMTRQSVGINSKGPEAAQNPDPNSSVLQGPDGTDTDSSLTVDSNEDDEDCWKKTKMSDSGTKVQVKITSECVGGKKSSLSAASKLKIHAREKPVKCNICSKCFIQKSDLKRHLKIHTGEKPFKCDVCNKCFILKHHLQSHMVIHTGEKPFKCDVCNKFCARKDNLLSHIRIHKKEKPFKCDVCSKCFKRKVNLKQHLRIHTGEKPFKYDVCTSKCVNQKSHLTKHTRIHTGEKPFKCDVCNKCFARKDNLQSHVRMHKEEEPFKL